MKSRAIILTLIARTYFNVQHILSYKEKLMGAPELSLKQSEEKQENM